MSFLHLFIVNKSGGLIHHRPLSKAATSKQQNHNHTNTTNHNNKIGTNEWLRIASTFHSLYAIAAEASPIRLPNNKNYAGADDGIEEIRASGMILQCLQTVTGIKFVVTVAISDHANTNYSNDALVSSTLHDVLKEIYVLYTECVLKDPFYELEMPIRSDLFVQGVDILIQQKYAAILHKIASSSTTATHPYPTSSSSSSSSGINNNNNNMQSSSTQSKLLY